MTDYAYRVWMASALGERAYLTHVMPSFEVDSNVQERCLAWMWLIVANSWRNEGGELAEEGVILLTGFRRRFPASVCVPAMMKQCGDFFWGDEFGEGFREVWSRNEQGAEAIHLDHEYLQQSGHSQRPDE